MNANGTKEKVGPTYGIIDSQSVKTTGPSTGRGIDGGKKKGRKRHIVTDTQGNLWHVKVHDNPVATVAESTTLSPDGKHNITKYPGGRKIVFPLTQQTQNERRSPL